MNSLKDGQAARWLRIVIYIGTLLFAVAIAWGTLNGRVNSNTDINVRQDKAIEKIDEIVTEVSANIREMKVEQKYIREGIDDIKMEVRK